eukprot:COSAG03_NODE_2821_length_2432_cov_2.468495_2_plen_82_part_00
MTMASTAGCAWLHGMLLVTALVAARAQDRVVIQAWGAHSLRIRGPSQRERSSLKRARRARWITFLQVCTRRASPSCQVGPA